MLTMVVLFVQVFVLNNLSISPLVAPMVYIVLILMMPIESSQWKMHIVSLWKLICGCVPDIAALVSNLPPSIISSLISVPLPKVFLSTTIS